jgi:glycosyltransferase involved in cell wall biosynthesis
MTRLNVLAVTNLYPPHHGGGYGLQMSLFCDGLAGRGHRVEVLTSRPAGAGAADGGTPAVAVRRELALLPPAAGPAALVRATRANRAAVRRAVRRVRPDVVFCGGMDGVGFNTYHAATAAGVPSLTWLGDTWLAQAWRDLPGFDPYADLARGGRRPGPVRWAKRAVGLAGRAGGLYAGRRPARFTPAAAISSFVAADLGRAAGVPPPPVVPIVVSGGFYRPDGEPVGRAGGRTPHLRALFVSRVELLKGPDVAVDAVAAAVAAGADVRLTIAGLHLDRMRPELEARAAAAGVADRVAWGGTPAADDRVRLYPAHDVFLFPSRIVEGLGVVNCEALACGLPVIGTADSGAADVIRDGETGFRVPVGDPAAVARHLAALHADLDRLERLSAAATAFARRYHPDVVVGQLERELARAAEGPA